MTYIQRKQKYNNKKITTGGRKYDSKKEASYAHNLEWKKKAGEINDYIPQYRLGMYVSGKIICTWKVDFAVILNDNSMELHEVKGFETYDYKLKRNLLNAINNSDSDENYITHYISDKKLDKYLEFIVIK